MLLQLQDPPGPPVLTTPEAQHLVQDFFIVHPAMPLTPSQFQPLITCFFNPLLRLSRHSASHLISINSGTMRRVPYE